MACQQTCCEKTFGPAKHEYLVDEYAHMSNLLRICWSLNYWVTSTKYTGAYKHIPNWFKWGVGQLVGM